MTAYTRPKVNLFFTPPATIVILIALALITHFPGSAGAMDLLLGAGKTGSFSHFVGKSICRAIDRQNGDLQCTVVPTPNEIHNITNLAGGSLDVCLIDSKTIYDAVNRKGNFEYLDIRYDNLLSLQRMYDVPIALIVRKDAGITALNDLKGKRINAGAPRSQQHLMVGVVLDAKGWTRKNFSLVQELPESQSQAGMAFCHGSIQAMVHIGVHPDPSVQQLIGLCGARLLAIDDGDIQKLISRHPAFIGTSLSGGIYPDVAQEMKTLGTGMLLVSSRSLDDAVVYGIMDALYSSRKQLENAHPALTGFADKATGDTEIGLAPHPGAVKYFSEN